MRELKKITTNSIFPLILVISFMSNASAQNKNSCIYCEKIHSIIEEITANADDGSVDADQIYEDLYSLCCNPIDINTASRETLEKIRLLNDFQITSLLEYRSKKGQLLSVYELQFVYGFSSELAEKIFPFITVINTPVSKNTFSPGGIVKYGSHELILRGQTIIENQEGYNEEEIETDSSSYTYGYLGSSVKLYARYAFHSEDKLYLGFLGEKDAGEPFFDSYNQAGFDFYSAYLQVNNLGPIKTLCLGNFNVSFGQGLTTWTSSGYNKSISVMNIRQTRQGFRRYTSADENHYFRGIAITTKVLKNTDFSIFYSSKKIDAYRSYIMNSTSEKPEEVFTTFINSGLHTTEGQFLGKDAVKENAIGASLNWKNRTTYIGTNFSLLKYDIPYAKDGDGLEWVNRIYNSQFSNFSMDYATGIKNLVFFGESAYSSTHGFATLDGLLIPVSSSIAFSLLYRNYSPSYLAIYGDAFSEASKPRNESGFYLGTEITPLPKMKVSCYFDYFTFPWLKYGVNAPSNGNEIMGQLELYPTEKFQGSVRFKYEEKDHNVSSNFYENLSDIKYTGPIQKQDYRLSFTYRITNKISGKNRFEYLVLKKVTEAVSETGWLFYQDVIAGPFQFPLTLWLRYTLFNTESFDTRIYAYENEMQYNYSCPAFYDSGCKYSLMVKYQPGKHLLFWVCYGSIYYPYKSSLGSGLNQTSSNTRSEVKIQVILKM